MPKFSSDIKAGLGEGSAELTFSASEDVSRWLDAEGLFWLTIEPPNVHQNLRHYWDHQRNFFAHVKNELSDYEASVKAGDSKRADQYRDDLQRRFQSVSNGVVITSDSPYFPIIVDFSKTSPDLSVLALVASRSDAESILGSFSGLGIPTSSLIKLVLLHGRSDGTKDWLIPQRNYLVEMRAEFSTALKDLREENKSQRELSKILNKNESDALELRRSEWADLRENFKQEWVLLKKVYDEQLALLAPTQYWRERAVGHRNAAWMFAAAFAVFSIALIGAFMIYAAPHLVDAAGKKEISPMLTLIPVAVPAFGAIWVLKIFSRLLSENLQMMRDARERETMVKTFLALMRDDKHGRELVRDEDRILILHSLFRPSSVSAADDAPPVHWFDILTNKVSSKGSGK